MKKVFLIFSGFNQRAVISFCRVAKKYNINFLIIANGYNDTIFLTEYKNNVVYIRDKNNMEIIYITKIIISIKDKYNCEEIIIIPNSEYIVRFMYNNEETLKKINVNLNWLVEKDIYFTLSDKELFCDLCKNNDINVPEIIDINNVWEYPVVVKPKRYFNNDNMVYAPEIINNKEELTNYFSGKNEEEFFIQKYIEGESLYLLFYIGHDYEVVYSQKNILQQPNGKSIILSEPIKMDEFIYKTYINLFRKVKYTGLIMVEIKKNKDTFIMIEANPRLWGPIQLIVDNNVPIIESFIKDLGFNISFSNNKVIWKNKYYWNGGYIKAIKEFGYVINYDSNKIYNIDNLIKYDIYNREDSKKIYELEGEL